MVRTSKRGVLALLRGPLLPHYEYDPELLVETTASMRRRRRRRHNNSHRHHQRPQQQPKPPALQEYNETLSEFTLFFLADAHNLNSVRFRPILVEFVQTRAKEECQCVCIPNHHDNNQVEECLLQGTGFACLPWTHEHRAAILKLLAATQVPSVIVVDNQTGRRVTDLGMQAIESTTDAKVLLAHWRRGESGLGLLQTMAAACVVS